VGIGIIPSKTPTLPNLLDQFLNRLVESKKLSTIDIVGKTGGSIPCEGPRQTVFQNILLAGDAAGHTHPITGAGILNAVIGGEIAGRVAAEAVARGDLKYIGNYEIEWREAIGGPLFYGAKKREFLEKNWNDSEIGFENLIRKTWVAFKEYYKDRKEK
jgi:flavin-dependent dehydrogenase